MVEEKKWGGFQMAFFFKNVIFVGTSINRKLKNEKFKLLEYL